MYRHTASMVAPNTLPSPENTSPSDSESEITMELEAKRREIDTEISKFRAQKEKEFRDFEKELRSSKRRTNGASPPHRKGHRLNGNKSRPARTSSSSALDLLIGHGMSNTCQPSHISPRKSGLKSNAKKDSVNTATTLPSKPTLSLDPQNIRGDIPHSNPHTPPTPTLLTRNIMPTPSTSTPPLSDSPPHQKKQLSSPQPPLLPTPTQDRHDVFTGVFIPTYLPLLNAKSDPQFPSPSPLATPPLESSNTIVIQQPIGSVHLPNGIVPLQSSSSYPPSATVFSPTNPANKRSYTAPTVSATRIPSALRTGSGGNIGRKRKRVTFRLADSAIVEPSSSYEEGPSPQMGESASTSTSSISSSRSSLKNSGHGPRSRSSLGSGKSSDQEDEEAGVRPGMNMGEVMQKLNEYSLSADDDDPNVEYDDEDVGHIDVKYHEDEDEDQEDEDEPMAIAYDSESDEVDQLSRADGLDDDDEEDGYFSPKAKHAASALTQHRTELQAPGVENQRHGSSPISPFRDENWDHLSSSDKDRLLFRGRLSDDDDSDQARRDAAVRSNAATQNEASDQRRNGKDKAESRSSPDRLSNNYTFTQAVDGGSGVGFFELDEELASPEAGVARPFNFSTTAPDLEPVMSSTSDIAANTDFDNERSEAELEQVEDITRPALSDSRGPNAGWGKQFRNASGGLKRSSSEKHLSAMDTNHHNWKTGFAGTAGAMPMGSVPINIIKPSPSVSSSWVGTFGH